MISSENVFKSLLDQEAVTQSDVVLAIFPSQNPHIMDMVEIDENGKIHAMFLKPSQTDLQLCWLCGVWTPLFTQFMNEDLQEYRKKNNPPFTNVVESKGEDLTVGEVLQAAIKRGLNVYGVAFPDGRYIDIGTPENLVQSIEMYGCQFS